MPKSLTSPIANLFNEQQFFSIPMLRLVGYGLITMALIDFVSLLIPLKLMNPVWEFNTIGSIIERMPIVLLGMVFAFFGERDRRIPIETILLKCLSWFCLIFAIFLLVSLPLSIISSLRIYNSNNAQVNFQFSNRVEALSKFQSELETAQSLDQISRVLQKQSNSRVSIPDSINKEQLKANIIQDLADNQTKLKTQAASLRSDKGFLLLKKGVKWNLGTLISACILLFIWQQTLWARMNYESEID